MPGLQITKVEVQGFRSFGPKPQILVFPSQIAAVWAPNSHGKTSLAEAFEFLLTGQIVRRELLASSQDEFAGALCNAHIPDGTSVFVQTEVVGSDGKKHTIRRTLTSDYGKKEDCRTALQIDGKSANEPALLPLGIVLSQPPLRGPVLTQHALGYLFSARPQERATYFKAVLEVTDLEVFRGVVAALEADVKAPDDPALTRLNAAAAVPDAAPLLGPLGYPRAPVGGTDRVVQPPRCSLVRCRPSLRQPVQGARGAIPRSRLACYRPVVFRQERDSDTVCAFLPRSSGRPRTSRCCTLAEIQCGRVAAACPLVSRKEGQGSTSSG